MTTKPNRIDCDEVMRNLFVYLDKEVDNGLAKNIEQHVEECKSCFSRVEFEKKLNNYIGKAEQAESNEELKDRLKALIKNF